MKSGLAAVKQWKRVLFTLTLANLPTLATAIKLCTHPAIKPETPSNLPIANNKAHMHSGQWGTVVAFITSSSSPMT
jgi:hypothetical protein